ncbi:MAG: efflux RND transporter periplasmic adaptor subunit [Elusimicrobia bacterium]|nr:efflux RND transporter periplasmic adaptor subunit [Elusimicrobiota bacterium]
MKNILLCATVLSLAGASLGGCKKKPKTGGDAPVPVVTAQVQKKEMPVAIEAPGTAEPIRMVQVTAQVDGQLLKVNFKEGDMVKQGDLLMVIDPAPYKQKLQKMQADLDGDEKKLAFLKSEEARYKKLVEGGAASQEEYETHKTELDKLLADMDGDRAQVAAAQLDLQYTQVRASISGKTGALQVHEGAGVKKSDTKLVSINQLQPIYVRFSVAEKNLSSIRQAMAKGPLKVVSLEQGPGNKPQEGKLAFIDNAVDPASGMILMKGEMPNLDQSFWPGEFSNITLTLDTQKDAVVVPAPVVQSGQAGPYVFVVRNDGTAEMRKVTLDRTVGDESVIAQGLAAGETVVTDGQMRLTEGAKVVAKTQ